ncbi:MAG TPA: D-hexose-6-phosphate mutarotase [Chromatiales bacterium]|nr:D-hexose-6-phosphate mutarotase [Chromatiales bacterium]
MIAALNREFGIEDRVVFERGDGGLTRAVITHARATATVYLHGAHVTAFAPRDASPVLWLSPRALFRDDAAIRGGVPVCWPWFGRHPSDPEKPPHGFARRMPWRVAGTDMLEGGAIRVRLAIEDDDATRALWPCRFDAEVAITVGDQLSIALTCCNRGSEPFESGGALHTYLAVADIARTRVSGLDGCDYLDQLAGRARRRQHGPVEFAGNVDRIYLDPRGACIVDDGTRSITVRSRGSASTVVWNPGAKKAAAMDDVPDDGYRSMVCVEAANAGGDERRVEPGDTHTLAQTISVTAVNGSVV